MKNKIFLFDIDMVLFPYTPQHIKFLQKRTPKTFDERMAEDLKKGRYPYLMDLFLQDKHIRTYEYINNLIEEFKETINLIQKDDRYKNAFPENELSEARAAFTASLIEFTQSEEFKKGYIQETKDLVYAIKQKNISPVGLTARGHKLKGKEREKIHKTTLEWNNNEKIGLDNILFATPGKKLEALKANYNGNTEILGFLEDDPREIEAFLKQGIPTWLINYKVFGTDALKENLKSEHPETLTIVKNHKDAKNSILKNIIYNKQYKHAAETNIQ